VTCSNDGRGVHIDYAHTAKAPEDSALGGEALDETRVRRTLPEPTARPIAFEDVPTGAMQLLPRPLARVLPFFACLSHVPGFLAPPARAR